jgi:hypothetical protein
MRALPVLLTYATRTDEAYEVCMKKNSKNIQKKKGVPGEILKL